MAPMNSPAARASRPARYYVNGHCAPPTASPAYTVGLCAAAAAMVVLPLIYLALVTLVGWLVFLHAIRDFGILAMDGHDELSRLSSSIPASAALRFGI